MSIEAMSWVWKHSKTKGSERLVLLALADNANDNGVCWPSIATIARKANLERRYVISILKNLESVGRIQIERRRMGKLNKSNLYTVVMRDTLPSVPEITTGSDTEDTRVVMPATPEPSINHQLESERGDGPRPRSNVFSVYEREIGPLTPSIAEKIKLAEEIHSEEKIIEAFEIASANNARNWAYVQAILERWRAHGYGNKSSRNSKAAESEPAGYAGIRAFMEEVENGKSN